jgi:hypothetical protein
VAMLSLKLILSLMDSADGNEEENPHYDHP